MTLGPMYILYWYLDPLGQLFEPELELDFDLELESFCFTYSGLSSELLQILQRP